MNRKESRQFNISVEGINCEKMYFEHLAKLINRSDRNTYNLKVDPKKMSPLEYAKRNAHKPMEKRKDNKRIPFIHVQDIEDYYDDFQRTKFYGMIDEMRTAEKNFGIVYELGYSNYTFELWMLLHVADMTHAVQDRHSYLAPVNRWFHRNYDSSDEFKNHDEFQRILEEFITIVFSSFFFLVSTSLSLTILSLILLTSRSRSSSAWVISIFSAIFHAPPFTIL